MITTVIPTYRRPHLLAKAIRSAQAQNIKNAQILVLDNCSEDETREVVLSAAKNDPRIRYICHSENIGAYENFKQGFEQVQTPYFSFLSDDDELLPGFYEHALASLEQHQQSAFYAASTVHIQKGGNVFWVSLLNRSECEFHPVERGVSEYIKGDFPAWTSIVFKKASCEKIGGLTYSFLVDEEFVIKLVLRFPYLLSNKPGAVYLSNSSEAQEKLMLIALRDREALIDLIPTLPDSEPSRDQMMVKHLRETNCHFASIYFLKALHGSNFQQAKQIVEFFKKHYPHHSKNNLFHVLTVLCEKNILFKWLFSACCSLKIGFNKMRRYFRYRKFS